MKFLDGSKPEPLSENGIDIILKAPSTELKTQMMGVTQRALMSGMPRYPMLAHFALENCIESISIDGTDHDPLKISKTYDPGDEESMEQMKQIGRMVDDCYFPPAEEREESEKK